jgi:hypothetical protein
MTVNEVFYWCVNFLKFWAARLNMTYEEINVYLFVIILPAILIAQFFLIAALLLRNK